MPEELAGSRVIEAAIASGALAPDAVVRHGVLVEQVGRSHGVFRVSIGGTPTFMVKTFGPTRGATDGRADRELAVLQLAQERESVAALVPGAWPWAPNDRTKQWSVVATAYEPGEEAWRSDHAGGGELDVDAAWADLVAAIVPPLARFHRETRDLARAPGTVAALAPTEPWGLTLMDGDAPAELWSTPVIGALLADAANDPALVNGLREARRMWRPLTLIHADLKHDNILLRRTATGVRVRITDWEMARIGDPAWDLATLFARLLVAREGAPPWGKRDLDGARTLITTYAECSKLSSDALAPRVVFYTGAVVLMMALQKASMTGQEHPDVGARDFVLRSRATFQQAHRLVAQIRGASDD
jgi:Ser/Thr protein kinase RdoA (MazF antagonist)